MKRFMAVYTGSPEAHERSGWDKLTEAQRGARAAEGMAAWKAWVEKHAAAIVEQGSPLGKTKRVSAQGISDTKNNLAAYVIVQAESHAAAAKLFENHPHFSIFPGDGVEIMECLPLPAR